MAPPRVYKSGIHDFHLSINADYQEDFDDLCHKQRKSRNQYINELIIQELERNSIAENDMPGESISCLGYTPKPVQQKITDTDNDENPNGIPILSSIKEIEDYLDSQDDIPSVDKLNTWVKIWNNKTRERLTTLRQALAYKNSQRVRA